MLERAVTGVISALDLARSQERGGLRERPIGTVLSVGDGVARVLGLPRVKVGEVLELEGGIRALAYDLDVDEVGAVLLDASTAVRAGSKVFATGRVMATPVGEELLGRVVDPLGRPLDGGPAPRTDLFYPVEREATPIVERAPVVVPLQTGIKVIDAFVPIGRGQRELILGDRQTGKTTIALDTILNQAGTGVLCVYVAIGQRNAAVAGVVATLRRHGAMRYTTVVVASSDDPPGMQYVAPYAATSMAEYFMERGRDVLIVYDDLTKHAYAYRELSLVLRRPPGREAFPSDIFYAHSRLLERATNRRRGGSLTALPIAETQAQDIAAYVPTNLISITDGQVYLDSRLFQKDIRPAMDVGRSVSRVGGKSQLPAFRRAVSNLKLAYSQFEELELFARLGTRLDEASQRAIRRGQEIRELFKQAPQQMVPAAEQVALLLSLTRGVFAGVPLDNIALVAGEIQRRVRAHASDVLQRIEAGGVPTPQEEERLIQAAAGAVQAVQASVGAGAHAGSGEANARRETGRGAGGR